MSLPALANDNGFRLGAPAALVDSGFLQYLLPRFTLKTRVKVEVVAPDADSEVAITTDTVGRPAFDGLGELWHVANDPASKSAGAAKFLDWLASDIGKRTIEAYEADGQQVFVLHKATKVAAAATVFEGDAALGEKLSLTHCGRCHVINETNKMNAIGSTPSFAVLRTFEDWENRFQAFHVLKPHGAFTQIEGVTEPFDASTPSPIVPVSITQDDVEAILAYVSKIAPADLGAPVQAIRIDN